LALDDLARSGKNQRRFGLEQIKRRVAMIRKLKQKTDRVTALELSGIVSDRDFEAVFYNHENEQVIHAANGLVIIANEDFEGFSSTSFMNDLGFFFKHREDFKRIALVTDSMFIRAGAHLVAGFTPFDVKVFKMNESSAAIDWSGSDGTIPIHRFNRSKGIVTLKPHGELEASELAMLGHDVDEYLKKHDKINGVIIEAKAFPGWHNIASLAAHLKFVKGHRNKVRRVCIISDDPILQRLPPWAEVFLTAEVRCFPAQERQIAQKWVVSNPG
jgi:hypothetical protein